MMATTRALSVFSDRLCAELRKNAEVNTIVSPLTIMAALVMLLGGANGETAEQIASALPLAKAKEYPYEAVGALLRQVSGGALRLAARIWAREGFALEPEFMSLTWHTFDAPCGVADFAHSEKAACEINAWIAERTEGKIDKVVAADTLSPDATLVLASAAHFKAPWATPFRETATHDEPFTRKDRSRVRVPMMHITGYFPYVNAGEFQLVELPYTSTREGEDLAMVVAVPRKIGDVPDPTSTLTAVAELRPTHVALALPRFRFATQTSLEDVLMAMGIIDAFSDAADFLGITQTELVKVSKAVHHAFIDVNEAGTEAAAVTLFEATFLGYEQRPEPKEVRADHPFLFFLRDRVTGAVLFTGWLLDPKN